MCKVLLDKVMGFSEILFKVLLDKVMEFSWMSTKLISGLVKAAGDAIKPAPFTAACRLMRYWGRVLFDCLAFDLIELPSSTATIFYSSDTRSYSRRHTRRVG